MLIRVGRTGGDEERLLGMTNTDVDGAPSPYGITFYGAHWCGDSRRSQALLDRLGVPYTFVDVELDAAASAWAARQNGGRRRTPTIAFGVNGPVLIEPTDPELTATLREQGLISGSPSAP